MNLNPEQKRAAGHDKGPMLVLAGPGTGKTATLVGRYAMLKDRGVKPSSILCCTFSKKAADELKARIRKTVEINPSSLPIGTFHALALRIIKEIGSTVGIKADVDVWSSDRQRRAEVKRIQDEIIEKGGYRNVNRADQTPSAALEYIDKVRENLLDPEDASVEASSNQADLAHAEVYAEYEKYLNESGKADFPRMVQGACKALAADNEADGAYAKKFTHILVDEYQDINIAQKRLIDLLFTGGGDLWVVGDDDQAIYGWRGGNVKFILDFEKDYPGATKVKLEQNYRSGRRITELSNNLSSHLKERHQKVIKSERDAQGEIACQGSANEDDEALTIAEEIKARLKAGVAVEEIAVLARINQTPRRIVKTLTRLDIPVVLKGGVSLFREYEARQLLAAVAESAGVEKNAAWNLRLSPQLVGFAKKLQDEDWQRKVKALATFLQNRPPKFLDENQVAERSKKIEYYRDYFLAYDGPENIFPKLATILRPKKETKGVFVGTAHSAKGLEWDSVFVVGMEDGLFPLSHNLGPRSLEEERRLAYVAITRAKNYLMLSMAVNRDGFSEKTPSRFLVEMFEKFNKSNVKLVTPIKTVEPEVGGEERGETAEIISFDDHFNRLKGADLERQRKEREEARDNREMHRQQRLQTIKELAEQRLAKEAQEKELAEFKSDQNIADGSGSGSGSSWVADDGFLSEAGYTVRKDGPRTRERQGILADVLIGREQVPEFIKGSVQEQWGAPNTPERLQKMRNTINSALGSQKARSNPSQQAIDKWEEDIKFIDETLGPQIKEEREADL